MKKILPWIKNNIFTVGLVILELILFATNYHYGTFFVGWDNLFPELNFPANFQRSIWGVWQEYRGLGLLDGMSFTANTIHYLFIYLLSWIVPVSALRYLFVFLMHLMGGLGMYRLLKSHINNLPAFAGALFYQFNLTTVQMFYAPYELFLVHFAFLPWLTYYLQQILQNPNKKTLIIFFFLSLLATPQAHVPTIFIVYLLSVATILLTHLWYHKKAALKNIAIILSIIFITNAFWGMPFVYSTLSNSQVIINSKINELSNDNIFLKNKARGNSSDVLYLKGFMLDEIELLKTSNFNYIMEDWRAHTAGILYQGIATILLAVSLIGLVITLKRRTPYLFSIAVLAIITFLFLATNVPGIDWITEVLRAKSVLFREVFRFTFTKFSILFAFCYSIFFAIGLDVLITFVTQRYSKYWKIVPGFILLFLLFYSLPAWSGHFIYDSERVAIPQEYFKTIDFFNKQDPDGRVATFPQPTFWSWRFYNWGARGSGFLWFGIKQPTMDRAFDPWSNSNEEYYWEMANALYSKNLSEVEKTLEKYQIHWLISDGNIIYPLSPQATFQDEFEGLMSSSKKVTLVQTYGSVKIYQVHLNTPIKQFVSFGQNIPNVQPTYKWNNSDPAFINYGTYQSNTNKPTQIYYPFRSLFTLKEPKDNPINFEMQDKLVIFKDKLPTYLNSYHLEHANNDPISWINPTKLDQMSYYLPEITSNNNLLQVAVPKVGGLLTALIDPSIDPVTKKASHCNEAVEDEATKIFNKDIGSTVSKEGNISFIRLGAQQNRDCNLAFWIQNSTHTNSYMISITSRNIKGKSLYFWLENVDSKRAEIESFLPKEQKFTTTSFILPPREKDGQGYTLHFDNVAYGVDESINDLAFIEVIPLPYQFISSLRYTNNPPTAQFTNQFEVWHPVPFFYKVKINDDTSKEKVLILGQSFDKGWIAWQPNFKLLTDHILINNWANGWTVNNTSNQMFYILYWPQLLAILGYLILVGGIIGMVALPANKFSKNQV